MLQGVTVHGKHKIMLYECDLSADLILLPYESYLPQSARDHKYTLNATISIRSWKKIVLVARVSKGQYQQRDITEQKLKIRAELSSPCSLARQRSLQRLFLLLSRAGDAKGLHTLTLLWLMVRPSFWWAVSNARLSATRLTKSGWIIIIKPQPPKRLTSFLFLLFSFGFLSCSWQKGPALLPALTR